MTLKVCPASKRGVCCCRVFPSLTDSQRQAIEDQGSPVALIDRESGTPYLLFAVQLSTGLDGSIVADLPGLLIRGEGDQPDDALIALKMAAQALSR